ncbi:spermidine synthase, putative [Leishmania panamensis]|uniref:Spermidine synthase, putative n=8 Tax=Viannia TaxID=37616 RepID=A0A088RJM8_LEIPA|nr:spermidine synthase, putative [Leishmania panamensis]AIN95379.1 spermidine synthase, putative [Leishmania panamensis]CCM12748.1 spermidine synthase, putative [Leishmania guyanensis]CCM36027.1 spermidine synthase, putative [Leishmania guyanensis]
MPGPGLLSDGWFREKSSMWPGQAQGLKVEKVLYDQPTEFQHLTVFESDPKGPWGTVMALDGAIQLTDYDEFVYHEMLANLSLTCHHKPERVLVIGGGDGGVVREVLRHKSEKEGIVQSVELVDIDGAVIEQSKRHFPQIACGLANPCVTAMVGDGVAFVGNAPDNVYDVVIIDTTDPEGPASELFGAEFYKNVRRILRPGGIVCNQGESIWLHRPLIEKMMSFLKKDIGFTTVKYAMIYTPTYPCGSIGTLVCAKSVDTDLTVPRRPVESLGFADELKYYSSDMHRAAFVLPRFAAYLNE